jgi:type I restriction enzyme S subunit
MRSSGGSVVGRVTVPLKGLLRKAETGWSPVCDATPPAPDEWGVLRLSAVTSGKFVATEAKRLPAPLAPRPAFEVKPGDVLMSRANGVKALVGVACSVGSVRPRLLLPDLVFRLTPDPDRLDSRFLGIALSSAALRRQIDSVMRGTSGQYKISKTDIQRLHVPAVPLEEQRRIVAVHAAFERRIDGLERELAKLDQLRRGLRDGGVSGPLTRLGEVLAEKPRNGYSPSEVHEWTGLLVLGLGCLTSEGFVPKQLKRIPHSPMARRFRLADGDLLMSRANTRELVGFAGRYQGVGQSCIYPDLMMRLRPDEQRCLPAYLEMALASSSVRAAVRAEARGTSESMVKISAGVVEALRIPLPSLERQREVVEAAALLDNRIVKQQAVVAKLRTVQRGVCEDLLRGQERAPDSASPVS